MSANTTILLQKLNHLKRPLTPRQSNQTLTDMEHGQARLRPAPHTGLRGPQDHRGVGRRELGDDGDRTHGAGAGRLVGLGLRGEAGEVHHPLRLDADVRAEGLPRALTARPGVSAPPEPGRSQAGRRTAGRTTFLGCCRCRSPTPAPPADSG